MFIKSILSYYYKLEEFGQLEYMLLKYLEAFNKIAKTSNPSITNSKSLLYEEIIKLYYEIGDYASSEVYIKELNEYNSEFLNNEMDLNHIQGQIFLSKNHFVK